MSQPQLHLGDDSEVEPINDMTPLCPNCHAILHRGNPVLNISELTELIVLADI